MFNVLRTYPAPQSLAAKKAYDSEDVHKALQDCFFGKCYICETKEPLDINIEHFIPRKTDSSKAYDWENLYLACARCNNIKLAKYENIFSAATLCFFVAHNFLCTTVYIMFTNLYIRPTKFASREKSDY